MNFYQPFSHIFKSREMRSLGVIKKKMKCATNLGGQHWLSSRLVDAELKLYMHKDNCSNGSCSTDDDDDDDDYYMSNCFICVCHFDY